MEGGSMPENLQNKFSKSHLKVDDKDNDCGEYAKAVEKEHKYAHES